MEITAVTEKPKSFESKGEASKDEAYDLLFPTSTPELSLDSNGYHIRSSRWGKLLEPGEFKGFLNGASDLLSDGCSLSEKLAVINACADISQKLIYESTTIERRVAVSELPDLHAQLRVLLESVDADGALLQIMKEGVLSFFDAYEQCPDLHIDNPLTNYELDVLGPVLPLRVDGLPEELQIEIIASNEEKRNRSALGPRYTPIALVSGQPALIAEGLVGFRGVDERIAWVAPIPNEQVDAATALTFDEYCNLDPNYQDYLSGTDYDLVTANHARSIQINGLEQFSSYLSKMDGEQMQRLAELYRPHTMMVIEARLGLALHEIPLEDQLHFLNFLSTRGTEDFEKLTEAIHNTSKGEQLSLLRAFLAIEQGDDFGDVLVDIIESAESEYLPRFLDEVYKTRAAAEQLGSVFPDQIQASVGDAMTERLTEILEVARHVAIHGSASETILDKFEIKVTSLEELTEDIALLNKSIENLLDTLASGKVQRATAESDRFNLYRFVPEHEDAKQVLLYVRPEGSRSYDPDIEYGRPSEGVEASISFIVSPHSDGYLSPYKKDRGQDEFSIRLDREGRQPGSHDFTDRDPTRETGTISLDIGSILGRDDSFGTRIGRIIALGNALRSEKLGRTTSLNHNSEAFDQAKFGAADGFKHLAQQMDGALSGIMAHQ